VNEWVAGNAWMPTSINGPPAGQGASQPPLRGVADPEPKTGMDDFRVAEHFLPRQAAVLGFLPGGGDLMRAQVPQTDERKTQLAARAPERKPASGPNRP